jgi:hypothetical protein
VNTGSERGIALALAIFALAIIGALVGATFFGGRVEQQSGLNTLFLAQAREAAEAGLAGAIATADPGVLEAMAAGGAPLSLGSVEVTSGLSASRQVAKLTSTLFLVRAEGVRHGADGTPLATRTLGTIVRLTPTSEPADSTAAGATALQRVERGWIQLY